eukprot:CAMPEP_0180672586 /NCGR_PEP_ID=MMETSP1037_2-20121125/65212_1 /TAXON_ID=632150 /ORGANISM="Azadinium spinosum, Strain 3D9" /LENGTH=40 /DNA_ID= /DNA_START= /DNA_END= /DNA_ORIENTATION=
MAAAVAAGHMRPQTPVAVGRTRTRAAMAAGRMMAAVVGMA